MSKMQELAEEAFTDLLAKHHRPVTLKEALLAASARPESAAEGGRPRRKRTPRKVK